MSKISDSSEEGSDEPLTSSEEDGGHDDEEEVQDEHEPLVVVNRSGLNLEACHEKVGYYDPANAPKSEPGGKYTEGVNSVGRSLRRMMRSLRSVTWKQVLLNLFPILTWLPKYNIKDDLANDVAAGFTVAVMQVPQGLAYAVLASVPPVVGIYTAFFPVLVYIFLGTSKHSSMGTFALVSILISKPITEQCQQNKGEAEVFNEVTETEDSDGHPGEAIDEECAMKVCATICFLSGGIMLGLGILRLGALNAFLTDPLVSGFTTGAGIHVFTSQIKYILGVSVKRHTGPGRLILTYFDLMTSYANINIIALIISIVSMFVLLTFDLAVKPRVSRLCPFPIPMQFIVVVVGTVISWGLDLKTVSDLKVIGHVPTGLPYPEVPDFSLTESVIADAFAITIIGFVVSLSIGRIVASRHGYTVNPNQELVAMGSSNMVGCFFGSLPMTASMSRTMVQEAAGGRSMVTSMVSVFLLIWVLLFAGPLFRDLPNAILASLIVVSLRGIITQFKDLRTYSKRSCSEALVWLATFVGTVFIDVDIGLIIGLATSLVFLLWWGYHPKVELIARTEIPDIFLDNFQYCMSDEKDSAIVRISGNLNLANAPLLEGQILDVLAKEFGEEANDQPSKIVLDLTPVPHIDPSACQQLTILHKEFRKRGQEVSYVGVQGDVWRRMTNMNVFSVIPKSCFYPTLQDAIAYVDDKKRINGKASNGNGLSALV